MTNAIKTSLFQQPHWKKPTTLSVKGTKLTPKITFNPLINYFEIRGRSLPENADNFYFKAINWLRAYSLLPNDKTYLTIKLDYFSATSARPLLQIFKLMDKINNNGSKTLIFWHYDPDDEDNFETALSYANLVQTPIKMVSYKK